MRRGQTPELIQTGVGFNLIKLDELKIIIFIGIIFPNSKSRCPHGTLASFESYNVDGPRYCIIDADKNRAKFASAKTQNSGYSQSSRRTTYIAVCSSSSSIRMHPLRIWIYSVQFLFIQLLQTQYQPFLICFCHR